MSRKSIERQERQKEEGRRTKILRRKRIRGLFHCTGDINSNCSATTWNRDLAAAMNIRTIFMHQMGKGGTGMPDRFRSKRDSLEIDV